MTVKALMTWNSKQSRWFKKYKGRQYTVSPKALGTPPTKNASIQQANAWWQAKQAELDQQDEVNLHAETNRKMAAWYAAQGHSEQAAARLAEADRLEQPNHVASPFDDPLKTGSELTPPIWHERFSRQQVAGQPEATLGDEVKDKIDRKRQQATGGAVSLKAYDLFRRCMETFQVFAGPSTPMAGINWNTKILDYHAWLLKQVSLEKMNAGYAECHIRAIKDFVLECVLQGKLPMPVILAGGRKYSNKLKIKGKGSRRETKRAKAQANKQNTWIDDLEGLKRMIRFAPDKTRLYILLALNCGYLNTDIAELAQCEIDWHKGTIKRERSKTAGQDNTPEVEYTLWDDTLKLLKQFKSDQTAPLNRNGDRVAITNKHGDKLQSVTVREDGRLKEYDAVKSAYRSFARTNGIKKPLQVLRHTGAAMIEAQSDDYGEILAGYYLGQAPQSTAGKHYFPDREKLAKALAYMAKRLGIKNRISTLP